MDTLMRLLAEKRLNRDLCVGNQITSFANGTRISLISDNDLSAGNVGLFAQPLGGEIVGAWSFYATFDDFYAEFTIEDGVG